MNKNIFLVIIFFTIVSLSLVSATDTNVNGTDNDYVQSENQDNINQHTEKNIDNDNKSEKEVSNDVNLAINKKYEYNSKSESRDWSFNISPSEVIAGDNVNITVQITDNKGSTINNGSLNYYLDTIFIGNSMIKNNYSSLTYRIPDDYNGNYYLQIKYLDENDTITDTDTSTYIKVNVDNTIILESDLKDKFPYDSPIPQNITVYLKDNQSNIINRSGQINFSITYPSPTYHGITTETQEIGVYNVENGICKFNFTLEWNSHWIADYIYVPLIFNFNYYDNITNKTYYYSKYLDAYYYKDMLPYTGIWGFSVMGYAGQTVTLEGNVFDQYDDPITTGRIVIKLNGKTIKSDIYLNGSNNFKYNYTIPSNLSIKEYEINYIYVENDEYVRGEDWEILNVVGKPVSIIANNSQAYAGETIVFNGSVVDNTNSPVTTGRIVIKLNGKTINPNITLNNSNKFSYKYKIPNYVAKDYKISYVYVENKVYARSELNKTLTIKNQTTKITANNIISYKDNTISLTVKITGAKTGINAARGTVGFKINGKTVMLNGKAYIQNITNGKVTFKYKIPSTLKADKYQITVTYSGGRNLIGNKINTSTLTVKDHITKITVKAPRTKAGEIVRILASVNDSVGKIRSGTVTFKLNNNTLGTVDIIAGAGILYYKIPDNYLGKYTIQVLAKGTYTDLNSTKGTLTVIK